MRDISSNTPESSTGIYWNLNLQFCQGKNFLARTKEAENCPKA